MRIATFNVQSLRLRRSESGARLDGARDGDMPEDLAFDSPAVDRMDRVLTAAVLRELDADIVALQEVFDQETLDHFHDVVLTSGGVRPYPHRICIDGNDGRGLDVAVISRRPLEEVVSHAALTLMEAGLAVADAPGADERIFRRDCLLVRAGELTLFVCHFKAPYPDAEAAWGVRRHEAAAVRWLIERRYASPEAALWMVVGDLNEPGDAGRGAARAIAPLVQDFAIDLVARIPESDRWSFHEPDSGRYSRPDAMLASPALAARWPDARPFLVRTGLGGHAERYAGPRFAGVGQRRPHASDHAALAIDLPGL
ncbi:MAG: endonuclease/exonuclease/phosphatase family protein [Sphingomonadaceae bacterium]